MKKEWIFIFVMITSFTACINDDIRLDLPTIRENAVLLSDLKVGQISHYLRYETTCRQNIDDFNYTGDTLIVEVIQKDGNLYLQESFTEGSPLYISGSTSPIIHLIESSGTQVRIPDRTTSRLFFFYANDDIYLQPETKVALKQEGCMLNLNADPFIGNDIGEVDEFKVGDITITHKTAVSCEPMMELDGYLLYDKYQLYMSHTIMFEEFNGVIEMDLISGWILL